MLRPLFWNKIKQMLVANKGKILRLNKITEARKILAISTQGSEKTIEIYEEWTRATAW